VYSLIVVILDYVLGAFDYIRRRLLFKMVVSGGPIAARMGLGDDLIGERIVGVSDEPGGMFVQQIPISDNLVQKLTDAASRNIWEVLGSAQKDVGAISGIVKDALTGIVHCSYYREEECRQRIAEVIVASGGLAGKP